jgi:endonuclease/exonuclease/phosphatase family metal-dependent hydrolase
VAAVLRALRADQEPGEPSRRRYFYFAYLALREAPVAAGDRRLGGWHRAHGPGFRRVIPEFIEGMRHLHRGGSREAVRCVAHAVLDRALTVTEHPPAPHVRRHAGAHRHARSCRTLTVLTTNLWHDWPRFRLQRERLEAAARLIEDEHVDVALLQEVVRTPRLRADEWLAERLGLHCVYTRANGHEHGIGFEEGLAIVSRFPLYAPDLQVLAPGANPFTRRMALAALVESPCGAFLACSAHLALMPHRNAAQLAHLQDWVTNLAGAGPAIVGGDFNAHENSAQIRRAPPRLADAFRHVNPEPTPSRTNALAVGRPAAAPPADYLFRTRAMMRPVGADARHLETPGTRHSDHHAVVVTLAA